jgi:hypothetical protein
MPAGYRGPDLCHGKRAGESYPGVEQQLFDMFGMEGTPKDGQFQVAIVARIGRLILVK